MIRSTVQFVHADAPDPDHVPVPHARHAVAPAGENVPLRHGRQVRFTADMKLPPRQRNTQLGLVPRPTKMVYGPAFGQTLHADAPPSE